MDLPCTKADDDYDDYEINIADLKSVIGDLLVLLSQYKVEKINYVSNQSKKLEYRQQQATLYLQNQNNDKK